MTKGNWPKISIITPTLNSSRTIKLYFEAIKMQKYKGSVEVLILDGGSIDNTLDIAKKYNSEIFFNKLKTAESGKALGVKKATGSIYAFIDSDNILPDEYWLRKMILPFIEDSQIIATEPIKFTYRVRDYWLTRYFALIGMGDPINLFLGNYDRFSFITNKWTNMKLNQEKKAGYIKIKLTKNVPTIGANGFFVKKEIFNKYPLDNYLFDIDVLMSLVKKEPIYISKINLGIIHLFSGDISTFIRKQKRRIRDYLFYKHIGKREVVSNNVGIYLGVLKFIMSCILIFPLIYQSIIGFIRRKDWVWIFHPLACYITLVVYGYEFIRFIFIQEEYNRKGWKQ